MEQNQNIIRKHELLRKLDKKNNYNSDKDYNNDLKELYDLNLKISNKCREIINTSGNSIKKISIQMEEDNKMENKKQELKKLKEEYKMFISARREIAQQLKDMVEEGKHRRDEIEALKQEIREENEK